MSAVTPPIAVHGAVPRQEPGGDNYLTHDRGFLSWALTLDHKRIGLLYMGGVLSAFFLGGVFVLFCAVFVIIMIAGGGLTAFVKSNMQKQPPAATGKSATTLQK